MTDRSDSFAPLAWRDALRPAHRASLDGWSLVGPSGVVAETVRVAVTPWQRMRGLLGRPALGPREALLIRPCVQVHGIGMRDPFDAVFCDATLRVVYVATIRPRRVSRYVRGADCCFELEARGAAACGIAVGDQLQLNAGS